MKKPPLWGWHVAHSMFFPIFFFFFLFYFSFFLLLSHPTRALSLLPLSLPHDLIESPPCRHRSGQYTGHPNSEEVETLDPSSLVAQTPAFGQGIARGESWIFPTMNRPPLTISDGDQRWFHDQHKLHFKKVPYFFEKMIRLLARLSLQMNGAQ